MGIRKTCSYNKTQVNSLGLPQSTNIASLVSGFNSENLQSAINEIINTGGLLVLPKGNYVLDTDVHITHSIQKLEISAYGATFSGPGNLILDSIKNLTLKGFTAKSTKIKLRGVWWSKLISCDFDEIIFGDEQGSIWSDNYWNEFSSCNFGHLLLDNNRGDVNQNTFYNCNWRSRPDQGFVNQYNYSISIYSDKPCQNLIFNNCDMSYSTINPLYVANEHTQEDSVIIFNNCYFDTAFPRLYDNIKIEADNCHVADNLTLGGKLNAISYSSINQTNKQKNSGWMPSSTYNLFKDGTFLTGKQGGYISTPSTVPNEYFKTGGIAGTGYVKITNPDSTRKITYFNVNNLPNEGYYTVGFYIKNLVAEEQMVRCCINNQYFDINTNMEWQFVTLCTMIPLTEGTNLINCLYTADNSPYTLALSNVFVTFGKQPQLIAMPDYKTYIDDLVAQLVTKNNLTL